MVTHIGRRDFLRTTTAASALLGLGDAALVAGLPPVSNAEAGESPHGVRLRPEIEPTVRLLEETPRERLLEEVAARIRAGLSYQEIVAALMLAGVRNVQPRPSVGFKFHAVLVVNSAHLASLASPDQDRWLPIFWALDYFKDAQARDTREGNWTMETVDESAVPQPSRARDVFVEAMNQWDEQRADAAVAALARSAGADEVFELFYQFGCRDFRSIGHKAIFVANARRTLQCIGWKYAEPILRSLAYALLNHHGEPNPATNDLAPDSAGRRNAERAAAIRSDWCDGRVDDAATSELVQVFREGSVDDACDTVVAQLNRGVAPQSVWDAVFSGAGELLMRQPGIVALHALTSTNALHFAFATSGRDDTRKTLLLQNAAFLPLFRQSMRGRGNVGNERLEELDATTPATLDGGAIAEILSDVSRDRLTAARKTMAYLRHASPEPLIDQARRLIFLKGNDAHDYKFSSAVLEDYYHVSPAWRDRFFATALFKLRGSGESDNPLVERIRDAFHA